MEVVKRGLQKIIGETIRAVLYSKREKYSVQATLFSELLGTSLREITRKGKWLLFAFDNSMGALNHLGMSGRWFVYGSTFSSLSSSSLDESLALEVDFRSMSFGEKSRLFRKLGLFGKQSISANFSPQDANLASSPVEGRRFFYFRKRELNSSFERRESPPQVLEHLLSPHIQLIFVLSDSIAIFEDVRTFGYFQIHQNFSSMLSLPSIRNLGPDILDGNFDVDEFEKRLKRYSRSTICSKLLDAKVIAGCGNIYRNEALFLAGINPLRKIESLSRKEIGRLADSLVHVAKLALERGGSSIRSFTNADGSMGQMQERFLVYGKEGFPCPHCSSLIQRAKFQQRSIFWCPKCQK